MKTTTIKLKHDYFLYVDCMFTEVTIRDMGEVINIEKYHENGSCSKVMVLRSELNNHDGPKNWLSHIDIWALGQIGIEVN